MTITAQRILTELGNKAWSGFNADDMVFESEDSQQAKAEVNSALRYIINLEDFPFRSKEQNLSTITGINEYNSPIGQITSIYNKDNMNTLIFADKKSEPEKSGEPIYYWADYNNPKQKLKLYPTPDNNYNLAIVYNQFKPVKDIKGNTKFEFENAEDFINLPDNLADFFMDCLVLKTMEQNNKDDQDENYQPIIKEFNERWNLFKKMAKPVKIQPRIVF